MQTQVQVIPKYVNPAKAGKKFGTIVDQFDNRYPVSTPHVGAFQVGVAADIIFEEQRWGQNMVKVVTYINGQDITGQAGPVHGGDRPAATPENVPQSDKEEGMFIMGVVGRAMGSGQFSVGDVDLLTKAAADAWKHRHDAPSSYSPNQEGNQAMEDIPDWVTEQ